MISKIIPIFFVVDSYGGICLFFGVLCLLQSKICLFYAYIMRQWPFLFYGFLQGIGRSPIQLVTLSIGVVLWVVFFEAKN